MIHTIKIPNQLYGRVDEIQTLAKAYDTAAQGEMQLVFVAGHSGIGKSSLVNGLKEKVEAADGLFIQGKQDQMERSTPYYTYLEAMRQLIARWEKEPEAVRAKRRSNILAVLGLRAQLIIDVLPELEGIIGSQPQVEKVPPLQAQNRFNQVFLQFMEGIASKEHPVVLFLDDLQWADQASLQFTSHLAQETQNCHLLLIGAYRDNEVDQSHPVTKMIERLTKEKVPFDRLPLKPLSTEAMGELLTDTLALEEKEVADLSRIMLRVTGGNPLFVEQYLKVLEEDRLIRLEDEKWVFDLDELEDLEVLEDAVDFIVRNMSTFSEAARDLISIAAAIGTRFSLRTLALIAEYKEPTAMHALMEGVRQGGIQPLDEHYQTILKAHDNEVGLPVAHFQFTHDKMQQAAYSLKSTEEQEEMHYRIGKAYRSALGYAATDTNVFEIVNQFNNCLRFIRSEKEKNNLAGLNIRAGLKAKAANAYEQAQSYFMVAADLIGLDNKDWDSSQMLDLYLQAAECAYLSSDYQQAQDYYQWSLDYVESDLERAQVYAGLLTMHNNRSAIDEAWENGLKALKALGVSLPQNPNRLNIMLQMIRLKKMIGKRTLKELIQGPIMTDEGSKLALVVLMELLVSSWNRGKETLVMVVLTGFEITLKHGNSPASYFGYAGYGAILGAGLGKIQKGWDYILAGAAVTERFDSMFYHGRGYYAVYGSYHHYVKHIRECIDPLEDTFVFSSESGDYNGAANTTMMLIESYHVIGEPLNDLADRSHSYLHFVEKIKNRDFTYFHRGLLYCIEELQGKPQDVNAIEEVTEGLKTAKFTHCRAVWNTFRLQNSYILQDWDRLKALLPLVEEEVESYALSTIEVKHLLYTGLAYLTLAKRSSGNEKRKHQKMLQKRIKEARKWTKTGAENYEHIYELLYAGDLSLQGKNSEAVKHYDAAIAAATKHDYQQNVAIASELKGEIFLQQGWWDDAQKALGAAQKAYKIWGADRKVNLLDITHGEMLTATS